MNGFQLIARLQEKMKNPQFATRFNQLSNELSQIPGLQQELMRISQIDSENKRQDALNKLPDKAKKVAQEMITLLNG